MSEAVVEAEIRKCGFTDDDIVTDRRVVREVGERSLAAAYVDGVAVIGGCLPAVEDGIAGIADRAYGRPRCSATVLRKSFCYEVFLLFRVRPAMQCIR